MALTRAQLRALVGIDTAGEKFITSTVVSTASLNKFVLNELKDAGNTQLRFVDSYALHPSSGEVRRIVSVDKAAGEATVHRTYTSLAATNAIEIHRYDPALIHQAINDGLARCARSALEFPTYTSQSGSVDLSALTYITSEKDILGVFLIDDTAVAGVEPPEEWPYARRFEDGFLYLDPAPVVLSGRKLAVRTRKPYDPLPNDAASTTCPELYVRAGVRVALHKLLLQRPGPGKEEGRLQRDYIRALSDFRHYAKIYGPHEGRKLQAVTPINLGPQYRHSF